MSMAPSEVDLVAILLHRAGIDPAINLMVRVASDTLRGVRRSQVAGIAEFALARVIEQESADLARNQLIAERMRSEAARAKRAEAIRAGTYTPNEDESITLHRAGTLLATAIAKGIKNRPENAKDGQLFAAMGLMLLNTAMQLAHGPERERHMLDAAECILGWMHVKARPRNHKAWIENLNAVEPAEFIKADGKVMSAKQAQQRFLELHEHHVGEFEVRTFGNEYTPIRARAAALARRD